MKVIVAGLPKTGTKTMNAALRLLGCDTIYDYPENGYYLYKEWLKIFKEGPTPQHLRQMYEGVDAVMDVPCCYYWEELAKAFPEAKIVFVERDENQWYKSICKQGEDINKAWMIWFMLNMTYSGIVRLPYRQRLFAPLGGRRSWPSDRVTLSSEWELKRMYRQHNRYVKEKAAKNRLLIFKLTDGWKPLCDFLNVDMPEIPFPHKNIGSEILKEFRKSNEIVKSFEREFLISLTFYVALAAFLIYKCLTWFYW